MLQIGDKFKIKTQDLQATTILEKILEPVFGSPYK